MLRSTSSDRAEPGQVLPRRRESSTPGRSSRRRPSPTSAFQVICCRSIHHVCQCLSVYLTCLSICISIYLSIYNYLSFISSLCRKDFWDAWLSHSSTVFSFCTWSRNRRIRISNKRPILFIFHHYSHRMVPGTWRTDSPTITLRSWCHVTWSR